MHHRWTRRLFGALLLLLCVGFPSLADEYEYFIQRADLDGTEIETVIQPSGFCAGIALDLAAGKVYFTDTGPDLANPEGRIRRANLDGSNVVDLVAGPDHLTPHALALDPDGGKMYWTDPRSGTVRRADLDGSGIETLIDGSYFYRAIALDSQNGKMYLGGGHRIRRANFDGTELEVLVYVSNSFCTGIALDVWSGKMYWTDAVFDKIERANLDGSDIETLVNDLDIPEGIALDLVQRKMYWVDAGPQVAQRAQLDGTGIETLFSVPKPDAIALDLLRGTQYVSGYNREVVVPAVSGLAAAILAVLMLLGISVLVARRGRP